MTRSKVLSLLLVAPPFDHRGRYQLGRRSRDRERWGERLPPGQKATDDWPVLHYGFVPEIDLATWHFTIDGLIAKPLTWTWDELMALPQVDVRNDIHCVTAWSKFDNDWQGVRVTDALREVDIQPGARFLTVHGGGGYTTNLTLDDLLREENLFAHTHNGEALTPEHGWPLRLVIPHLYFWKSVKWVSGLTFESKEEPGFWESYGYHMRGDPWKQERYD